MSRPFAERMRLDVVGGLGAAAGLFGFFWFLSSREFTGAIISAMIFALGLIAMQAAINGSRAKRADQVEKPTLRPAPGGQPGAVTPRGEKSDPK